HHPAARVDAPRVSEHLPGGGEPGDQGVSRPAKGKGENMNPKWRTSTVVALCRRMLVTRQFDPLPILADALQDPGCSDNELLTHCQDPDLKSVLAERLVNLVYSDETAAAVRWLEQFVRDINHRNYKDEDDEVGTESDTDPHTYEYIIQTGHQGIEE